MIKLYILFFYALISLNFSRLFLRVTKATTVQNMYKLGWSHETWKGGILRRHSYSNTYPFNYLFGDKELLARQVGGTARHARAFPSLVATFNWPLTASSWPWWAAKCCQWATGHLTLLSDTIVWQAATHWQWGADTAIVQPLGSSVRSGRVCRAPGFADLTRKGGRGAAS